MKVTLRVYHLGLVHELPIEKGQSFVLGRSSKCNFPIEDKRISSRHCRIYMQKDRLEIVDLESKNGTYLNGIRIEKSEIFIGDEVKIGDIIITCDEKYADEEAKEFLNFPGPFSDRINYELKADFTNARLQNQKKPELVLEASHELEISVRKVIKTSIRLSKEEILRRNKKKAFLAKTIDIFLLIILLGVPFYLLAHFTPQDLKKSQRLIALAIMELIIPGTFALINFNVMRFTIGEKTMGLEHLYKNQ